MTRLTTEAGRVIESGGGVRKGKVLVEEELDIESLHNRVATAGQGVPMAQLLSAAYERRLRAQRPHVAGERITVATDRGRLSRTTPRLAEELLPRTRTWPNGNGNGRSNTLNYLLVQPTLITSSKKRSDEQHHYSTALVRAPGIHTGIFVL